jgi:hypothetical protein
MAQSVQAPKISVAARVVVYIALAVMASGSLGLMSWGVLWPALQTGKPPASWTWQSIIGIELALAFVIGFITTLVVRSFGTRLTDQGVSFLTWRGRAFLSWARVETVEVNGYEIVLKGDGLRALVNTASFSDPDSVGPFIYNCLPKHVRDAA